MIGWLAMRKRSSINLWTNQKDKDPFNTPDATRVSWQEIRAPISEKDVNHNSKNQNPVPKGKERKRFRIEIKEEKFENRNKEK